MKFKSFLLGFLVCYIFCFLVLLGVSIFNSNKVYNFGEASDLYYEISDGIDARFDKMNNYNLSETDKSCLNSLKEYKKFSDDTSKIGSISVIDFAKILWENYEGNRLRAVSHYCNIDNYHSNDIENSFDNISFYYNSIYDKAGSIYCFGLSDSDYDQNIYYNKLTVVKETELKLISDILDLMEDKYE